MINLFNEDCISGMAKLPDKSVDCIVTDVPYGMVEYAQDKRLDLQKLWFQFKRLLKAGGSAVLFASGSFTLPLIRSNLEQYKYKWIWVKNAPTQFINAKNKPLSAYEEILIFSNGVMGHKSLLERQGKIRQKYNPQGLKPYFQINATGQETICKKRGKTLGARPSDSKRYRYVQEYTNYPRDVLYFDAPFNGTKHHPNEKPVDLLEYLICTYSDAGEVVLDATMGSGSTGVAALKCGRQFIGYELDAGYFNIAKRRIMEAINNDGASVEECDIQGANLQCGQRF